jgi:secondary thiamine-phosphate synthase enzyme
VPVKVLTIESERRTQLVDVTAQVQRAVNGGPGTAVLLFVPHTTAGLVIQASGSGASRVATDIEHAMEQLVDEGWNYEHVHEGDRNPWAHVRAALTASSLTIPIEDGQLGLSQLQSIFLCEFDGPRERELHLTFL